MLTKQEVEHIAQLARLGLSEDEKEKFREQLSKILDYVNQLQEVNTKNIEPISQITGLENIERGDLMKQGDYKEKLLKLAPERENNHFKVKAVF